MNILFLNAKKSWAGVISWTITLTRNLNKKNHNCFIITGVHSSLKRNKPKDIDIYEIKYGMNFSPMTLIYLVKFIKKNKIDIIVTNITKEVIFGGIAGKLTRVPVIRRIGNEKDFNSGKFLDKHFVDKFLFPCNYTRLLAIKNNDWLKEDKTKLIHTGKVIPYFTEEEIEAKRKQWNVSENDIVIGISDRLDKNKGIDLLIKVFDILSKKYNNIKLIITGQGGYRDTLENLVKDLNLNDKVHFAGFVTDIMLTACAYDIAVLASYFESFPNAVIEYMASNTAVICTNVGGVSELVKNNENGFLIEKKNSEQLENALEKLIQDNNLRIKFAENALETVRTGFSEDIMSNKVIEFFRELKRS